MEKIYFCRENEFKTKKIYKALKMLYPNIKIKRKDCLGKCKTCKSCPFSLLDGELVKGPSIDDLYLQVNKRIYKEGLQIQ